MAEILALVFIFVVIVTLIGYFFCYRSIGMSKAIFSVIVIGGIIAGCLVLGFWFAAFFVWLFMLLFNASVASYLGLSALTFWKAWGFLLVSAFLFKGGVITVILTALLKIKRRK